LEVGWESTFSNKLSTSSGDSIKLAIPIAIPSYFDNFNYNEKIHAAYLTYGTKIGKFSYQLGLRGELLIKESTNTTKIGKTMNDTVQFIPQKSFFHIFPSFYLSYALPNDAEIQFNYSNRVNRPRGQQINPFRNYSDPTNISYGNPDLKPQYLSALELNYIKTWGAQTLSSSLYYHNTDNVIEGVRFLHHGVMESTFLNIAKSQNAGLEVISKNRLLEVLSLTSTLNMYYSKLDAATYVNPYDALITTIIPGQSIFSWSGNVMANLMLSKNLSGQITGEYESPELIAQGKETAKYTIDLGVRQTFLDRKLSVSFNIRDLLNSDRHSSITYGSGFYQTSSSYFHGRMAMMTVSYNFGNIKPKITEVKKKESGGEMNMDMSE
jgi:outer membrane receptor protein involved in Fe transport